MRNARAQNNHGPPTITGVNDEQERNIIGGGLPNGVVLPGGATVEGGYDHNIEFYSGQRNDIVGR